MGEWSPGPPYIPDEPVPDDKGERWSIWTAEWVAFQRVLLKGGKLGLSQDQFMSPTLKEHLADHERGFQFRRWEEEFFKAHPDAPGYALESIPGELRPVGEKMSHGVNGV